MQKALEEKPPDQRDSAEAGIISIMADAYSAPEKAAQSALPRMQGQPFKQI